MTIRKAYYYLCSNLTEIYNKKEAANIAELTIEKITGLSKVDRIVYGEKKLNDKQTSLLENYNEQLLKHKPVQYVLNEAWFAGVRFYVDEHVLIPRPETQELVNWIITDCVDNSKINNSVLDIGTGSGCIAIALKKKLSALNITALDISNEALKIASQNAEANDAIINFITADITQPVETKNLDSFDVIVSNPPYITKKEALSMDKNVLLFEPHLALFVTDENPFLFYESISNFALHHLTNNSFLYFEINESYANEVAQILYQKGFQSIETSKDLQGKDRMIKAALSLQKTP